MTAALAEGHSNVTLSAMECEAQHHAQPANVCQFWMPMKNRCCGWKCKEGEQYCGNHLFAVTGNGEERVPCPANPKHDVPVSQLKAHLRKCPEAARAAESRAQPYFFENLNSGAEPNVHQQSIASENGSYTSTVQLLSQDSAAAAAAAIAAEAFASFLKGTAEQRIARAIALGPGWFCELLTKVDAAHAALTAAYPLNRRLLGGCEGDLQDLFNFSRQLDPLMPFDRKHAAQHASIVGNMEAAGLLSNPQDSIFVELGAGKGFLSAWLHQVCGARELILLDRQGNFSKKADRRLRHTRLTRVAVDLKDARLLPLMQLHLRGQPPVTAKQREHQLRLAKVHKQCQQVHQHHLWQKQHMQQGPAYGDSQQGSVLQNGSEASEGTTAGGSQQLCNGSANLFARSTVLSTDRPLGQPVDEATRKVGATNKRLKNTNYGGLICCPAETRGFVQQGQQQMAWVAHGKHLCGAAADFALRTCYNAVKEDSIPKQQDSNEIDTDGAVSSDSSCRSTTRCWLRGLAIATCCHHRCGWTAYCGRDVLQQYGISKIEFETIAWLTSWALCGHDAAPGAEDGWCQDSTDQLPLQEISMLKAVDADKQQPISSVTAGPAGVDAVVAAACNKQLPQQHEQGAYHPADLLDRPSRIALGLKCKQLLDAGRCTWVQQMLLPAMQQQDHHLQDTEVGAKQQLAVQRVAYVDQSVTGENTLLLLGTSAEC